MAPGPNWGEQSRQVGAEKVVEQWLDDLPTRLTRSELKARAMVLYQTGVRSGHNQMRRADRKAQRVA